MICSHTLHFSSEFIISLELKENDTIELDEWIVYLWNQSSLLASLDQLTYRS